MATDEGTTEQNEAMQRDLDMLNDPEKLYSEWERRRYKPGPGDPELPPQLREMRDKSIDQQAKELKKLPFFMTELDESEPNELLDALQALQYEGEPKDVAGNFKFQGNECHTALQYKDAIEFYTKALNVQCNVNDINLACLLNRAACQLELRNYRKCINDCKLALKLDDKSVKALYRSARAYAAVDRNDEALGCLEYALTLHESDAMRQLKTKCEKRKRHLKEFDDKRKQREEAKLAQQRNLDMAVQARKFTLMKTVERGGTGGEELKIQLEDSTDPHSPLLVPLLCLYPLEMQSDMVQPQDCDQCTVQGVLDMLFEQPPPWANNNDYTVSNLEVYAQTDTGGLAKVGKKSTVSKILSMAKPVIPIIDNTCRLYIVPKTRVKEFVGTWVKDAAAHQLESV